MDKKRVTLQGIKDLWQRTGRSPRVASLITQEMIDEVVSQSCSSESIPIQMPQAPRQKSLGMRLAWGVAASVAVLLAAGIWWTYSGDKTTIAQQSAQEQEFLEVHLEQPEALEVKTPRSRTKEPARVVAKNDDMPNESLHCESEEMVHEWQTEQRTDMDLSNYGNSGMVCYSGGQISSHCDEETVTAMLLAFL